MMAQYSPSTVSQPTRSTPYLGPLLSEIINIFKINPGTGTFSIRGQIVNILDLVDQKAKICNFFLRDILYFLHFMFKTKTLLSLRWVQKQVAVWIWPADHILLTPDLNCKSRFLLLIAEGSHPSSTSCKSAGTRTLT
jgi:hypothetical protein